jgi:SAM-dependent methyltransferase
MGNGDTAASACACALCWRTIVDVFSQAMQSGGAFLSNAALAAGHEIGVFEALSAGGSMSLEELAEMTGVSTGRHRLRALLEVLAALGAVRCERAATPSSVTPPFAMPRFGAAPGPVPHPAIARAGWGLLADVIRGDRPLPVETGDGLRRLHHHLADAGADAARELVGRLGTTSLLDLGAGAGAYSKAFLLAHPAASATLVDTPEVLSLARERLGPLAERCRLVEGDASTVDAGDGYGAALLANVLHLHSPPMCARLCAAAARAVAPGGLVVIKDLRVDDDRSGPLDGLLFALNMAIYTEAGDVYSTSQLRTWLTEAGLVDVEERRLAAAPDAVVVVARRARRSDHATEAVEPRGELPTPEPVTR